MSDFLVFNGDCLDIMDQAIKGGKENSIDAVVTDPPYGLKFMGKQWDHGVPGKMFWEKVLKLLKPGGYLLAFGGTRTYHRLACAIEDAGFEIRDCVMWMYGSGFPKSHDVSKAIDKAAGVKREVVGSKVGQPGYSLASDKGRLSMNAANDGSLSAPERECAVTAPATEGAKQWDGWGTALKPAWEPIILARKPFKGTVAKNVLEHGTGGINVDGCRISTEDNLSGGAYAKDGSERHDGSENWRYKRDGSAGEFNQPKGRWPANVILTHHPECECVGMKIIGSGKAQLSKGECAGGVHDGYVRPNKSSYTHKEPGHRKTLGKETLEAWKCHPDCPVGVLDEQSIPQMHGASRFFYCAKASKKDRTCNGAVENKHPTVKPNKLMRYLCRLITPPDGKILDPFMGSGSTGIATLQEGFNFIGIELEESSYKTAEKRLEYTKNEIEKDDSK